MRRNDKKSPFQAFYETITFGTSIDNEVINLVSLSKVFNMVNE